VTEKGTAPIAGKDLELFPQIQKRDKTQTKKDKRKKKNSDAVKENAYSGSPSVRLRENIHSGKSLGSLKRDPKSEPASVPLKAEPQFKHHSEPLKPDSKVEILSVPLEKDTEPESPSNLSSETGRFSGFSSQMTAFDKAVAEAFPDQEEVPFDEAYDIAEKSTKL
jgi:hypothetical protein